MQVPSFTAKSKRKTHAQDENAAVTRIPVKSSSASALATSTSSASRSPKKQSPQPKSSGQRSSIPFPKSPAPAVVTPLLVDAQGRVNALQDDSTPRVGRRARPSTAAKTKSKEAKAKAVSATGPSLWRSLLSGGKGVIAQTFDRDRECRTLAKFHACCHCQRRGVFADGKPLLALVADPAAIPRYTQSFKVKLRPTARQWLRHKCCARAWK